MADLIDRQAAIDAIEAYFGDLPIVVHHDMLQLIKALPSAQPEPRWIPVEEKLPDVGRRVLVTIPLVDGYPFARIARYGTQMFENKVCFYESVNECVDCEISGVTAWMPLPKPYKEDSDG